ncbi:MAG: glucose-1-phosphate cytidylyltransferase [Pseudomonadota bacterium]
MQVVILCGGLGTRLREETEFRPKPMVNIGSRPILWHIMKIYAHYNISEFVLALGYKGEMIKDYFIHYEIMNNDVTIELGSPKSMHLHNCHDESGWKITLANTGDKAMKGARLKKVENYIHGENFMLTYGDGVADINIESLIKFHKQHGKIATVTGVNPAAQFGELKINGDSVQAFSEKPKISERGYVNGGFFVFKRAIFDYLEINDACDLEYGVLEKLAAEGELKVYKHQGFWACMDTIRDMEYLNSLWGQNRAQWKIWK